MMALLSKLGTKLLALLAHTLLAFRWGKESERRKVNGPENRSERPSPTERTAGSDGRAERLGDEWTSVAKDERMHACEAQERVAEPERVVTPATGRHQTLRSA